MISGNTTPNIQTLTAAIQTFPAVITLTGNYITTGLVVTGTGTKFLTEASQYLRDGFLYSSGKAQYRKVRQVNSDTELILETIFATDVTSESVKILRGIYDAMTLNIIGATNGAAWNILSGTMVLIKGEAYEFGQKNDFSQMIPEVVDATGTTIEIVTHK